MINKRNIVGAGIVLSVLMTLLCGCQALEKKQQVGAVAELNGQYLYRSTLDSLTLGLNSEDSLRVVQLFIRQWAQDILLYDNSTARTHREIEQMVSEYRRTLYAQAYEDRLVERRMPKSIPDSAVQAIYDRMPDRFILDESIVKGVLLVVPNDAPNLSKVKQWLLKIGTERQERKERKNSKATNVLDDIEKYVYQNASGYELFRDETQIRQPDRDLGFDPDLYSAGDRETYARRENAGGVCPSADRENHPQRPSCGVPPQRARTTLQRCRAGEEDQIL